MVAFEDKGGRIQSERPDDALSLSRVQVACFNYPLTLGGYFSFHLHSRGPPEA